jgi:hypothetical protein
MTRRGSQIPGLEASLDSFSEDSEWVLAQQLKKRSSRGETPRLDHARDLMAEYMKIYIFWDMTPCWMVHV